MIRAGYVALVGSPNAGKSTLLNTIIGEKLSIVSDKPQSTRKRLVGIYSAEDIQVALVDSPGFVENEKGLNGFIKEECENIIENTDFAVLLLNVDALDPEEHFKRIESFSKINKKKAVLISKSELSPRRCIILEQRLKDYNIPTARVSALENPEETKKAFISLVKESLPESDGFLFSEDDLTTSSMKDIASEKVREACYEYLHQEIPYALAVQIRKYDENGKVPKIYADIILDKENHKVMVIGRKGEMIKRIGTKARKEIEKILGRKVYLELFVNVRKKWIKDKKFLEELGYVVRH